MRALVSSRLLEYRGLLIGVAKAVRLFCITMLVALASQSALAQIELRTVDSVGHGGDASSALLDALETAIGQVTGQRLASSVSLSMAESTQGGVTNFAEEFRQKVEKATRGVVKSYTVIEQGVTAASGRTFVKIRAVIPVYRQSEQLKRLRLALVPVAVANTLAGQPAAIEFAEAVSSATEAFLTQTRKFAMIDRKFGSLTSKELARVNSPEMAIEETVRVGAKVGADYLVIASLREFAASSTQERRPTGRIVERTRVPVAVDVRVIDIASGQIKFAQVFSNSGRLPLGMSPNQFASELGADIGQLISSAIYPIAVVSVAADIITLNQGGETVRVGRQYRLVRLGRNLIDPYTKESLGQEELEVGRVEVISVTDRTSAARLVRGTVPESVAAGSLLARLLPDEPGAVAAAVAGAGILSSPALPNVSAQGGGGKKKDDDW